MNSRVGTDKQNKAVLLLLVQILYWQESSMLVIQSF